ncbi:unnamed protein product, partial [Vitis vinifera]
MITSSSSNRVLETQWVESVKIRTIISPSSAFEFQKIKSIYISDLNPRNVLERLDELCTLHAVDDQGALPRNVSAVPHLTLPGTNSVAPLKGHLGERREAFTKLTLSSFPSFSLQVTKSPYFQLKPPPATETSNSGCVLKFTIRNSKFSDEIPIWSCESNRENENHLRFRKEENTELRVSRYKIQILTCYLLPLSFGHALSLFSLIFNYFRDFLDFPQAWTKFIIPNNGIHRINSCKIN